MKQKPPHLAISVCYMLCEIVSCVAAILCWPVRLLLRACCRCCCPTHGRQYGDDDDDDDDAGN
jgi:hypothetical protein